MKQLIEGMIGVNSGAQKHKRGGGRTAHFAGIGAMTLQNADKAADYEARHPIVRTHPDTGRKALYVTALHTLCLNGMTEEESRPLIGYLNDHCIENEFTCRVRWEPGQLTLWDNRCTMHHAVNDYHGSRREMHRLIVGPEVPI
jgi:taurine dioxygenase